MVNVIKILLFAIVNAIGFYTTPIMANVAVMTDSVPKFSSEAAANEFHKLFFAGGGWVWACAAILSVGYFIVKSVEIRMILILAPVFAPILYCVGVLGYYKFM